MTNAPPWVQRAVEPRELIEPTPEEVKNGWTAELLTAYVHEASARQNTLIGVKRRQPIRRANGQRWKCPVRGRRT